jgi:hypothetical protein
MLISSPSHYEEMDDNLKTLIYKKGMNTRIDLLTCDENYLDLQQLLSSLQSLLKERKKNSSYPNQTCFNFIWTKLTNMGYGVV